jgi:choline dehydrogenase-like flavoprotein
MSDRPELGVVDTELRTHDHPNLYIVGSAVFDTAGYANPTLTDVALGIRLGDHLRGLC